jgi:N-methylhydantoinase B
MGTWGGRPTHDGAEGVPHPGGNQPNQPIEMIEARQPLQVTRYGLIEDSGGPGRFRGGLALVRELKLHADEAVLTLRTDRRTHLPYGLQGGKSGTPAWNILNPGPHERILPTLPMEAIDLKAGDVVRIVLAGGGGYGDPLERDPAMVIEDVLDQKLSIEYVNREYGVIIDRVSMQVDTQATARRREEMRRESGE